ncbi:ATP-binding cassette domain-containing protein [Conservatibacter flavescens]|uniref:Peptide ABC transporter ATP-binding protein n=1 Tax=Conservatibacter flavescens TaxID=28161 RepID=A0A2M8S0A2_9PAST|nr:ATP-binding cassette domain-containing protein [Conservatibacter flavescens]PJG84548.1 peptide ABC transporter ATP-binding protein [Conservatibacter flavescens]
MTPLLQVEDLSKSFTDSVGLFGQRRFSAVNQISFSLERKKTLAIIGHNGSGKSTLAKMIVGITEPSAGKILFNGNELYFGDHEYRAKHIRMVFQDVNNAFNPRLNVGQILDAPLRLLTNLTVHERNEKIGLTLRMVGLYPDHANIKISTMSISQKQRVALARAVILEPEIIIADDALGSLDSSVKTQLINLMLELQNRLGVSYIYVGQHLGIIKHMADEVLVMDNGQMIEYGTTRELFSAPQTEITRRLVESHFGKELDNSAWESLMCK